MGTSEIHALERSDLNAFLFSVVGSEPGGMPLTVVSLLARRGADPWREAGWLASLPKEAANEWLVQAIAGAAASTFSLPDAAAIAARLTALLPSRIDGREAILPRWAWFNRTEGRKAVVPLVLAVVVVAAAIAWRVMDL